MAIRAEGGHVATAREEVLLYGLIDWVPLERVHWYVARANDGASMSTIQLQTLEIIRSLVSEGLFEIGELNSDSRFSPWTSSLDESSERIRDHYVKNFDDENSWWFSCWLDLTEKGRQVAEEIEQRLGTIRGLSADDSQAEQRRLAAASSLISVVADHVDDFTAVTGDAVPEWVYRLPLPAGWRSVQINARSNNQPARVAVYGQQPDGRWKATETLSLFRFTGSPSADIVYEKSDCTLRDLAAPLGDANAIVGPPTTEVLDTSASTVLIAVRSSGQFVVSQRWTWAQYSTYIAPSEPPDQSLMLQQILHVDSTCREELEADIAQLSDTVLQAFITEP